MTIKFQNQGYLRESDMDAVGIMKVEDNHKKQRMKEHHTAIGHCYLTEGKI